MIRPRIGLSSCIFPADPVRAIFKGKALVYMEQSIGQWLSKKGALTYLIPPHMDAVDLQEYADDIDGLVLQGGTDVAPENYGERPMRPEWSGDPIRDVVEIELAKACHARGVPILGICRGAQLLNVAFGGSLYQDITTQVEGAIIHRDWDVYDQNTHAVTIDPTSRLGKLYKGEVAGFVNSVHHQAIKTLAPGFSVSVSSTEDGIIEAIEHSTSASYLLGVQWHPEFQSSNQTQLLNPSVIVEDFLSEASVYKQSRI